MSDCKWEAANSSAHSALGPDGPHVGAQPIPGYKRTPAHAHNRAWALLQGPTWRNAALLDLLLILTSIIQYSTRRPDTPQTAEDMSGEDSTPSSPLLKCRKGRPHILEKAVRRLRQSLSEQTPSTLLILALLFGVLAGFVAFVYSKCDTEPSNLALPRGNTAPPT